MSTEMHFGRCWLFRQLTTSFNSSSLQHRKSRQSLCLRRSICARINWTRCISCSILQQFVSRLDQDDLCAFLQFVTGSSVMPRQISVTFNTLAGEMRRPIALLTHVLIRWNFRALTVHIRNSSANFRQFYLIHWTFRWILCKPSTDSTIHCDLRKNWTLFHSTTMSNCARS